MARRIMLALIGVLALPAGAELRDPTRPPASLAETPDAVPAGPVLQAIRIEGARRSAVISGQEVRAGSMFGEMRVVRIEEDQVVLRNSAGTTVLKLFPAVQITRPQSATAPQTRRDKPETRKDKP